MRVGTVAALRALPPATARVVQVSGYHRPEDGGGGLFRWVADLDAADDCGMVIAPESATGDAMVESGRWRRDADAWLELSWFGAHADGETDDGPALQRAIDCATRIGHPLLINPGVYHLASDVKAEIGPDQALDIRGDGATFRRSGASGAIFLDAENVAMVPVTESILPGGDGLTVANADDVAVGDLVELNSGLRLSARGDSSWTATESGRVAAIRGNRLVLDAPTHNRVHPNRRLAYRMDGQTDRLHYRLFWGAPIDEVRVDRDGQRLRADRDYTISGAINRGYDIAFSQPPAAGSEIVLSTADPIYAHIQRGGRLSMTGLRFESDFAEAGPVAFLESHGLAPAGSRFADLALIERNAPLDEDGYRDGVEGDLFRVGLIDSVVEDIRIEGGRYSLMALRGRNMTYRNITAEGCWHAVASFGANTVNIENVTAIRCYAAVDSHYAHVQHVDGVEGIACRDGMNHRANGGSLRNASLIDNTSDAINGLNFGIAQGAPIDDMLLADPRDNPQIQFSDAGTAKDMEIADCRFAAPADAEGFGLYGSFLRRLSLRGVETDGPVVIDGQGPRSIRQVIIDRLVCRHLVLRGVTESVVARRLRGADLDLRGCRAPTMRFEDCVFDGAGRSDVLIIDGAVSGDLECQFVGCTFRNADRLLETDDGERPVRRYLFTDCIFEVADTAGFG